MTAPHEICDACETCAHCLKHGCIPLTPVNARPAPIARAAIKRIDSTKIMWQMQTRKSKAHKWKNAELYETRVNARYAVSLARAPDMFGRGNTRVVRYVKPAKASGQGMKAT